jgi:rod shape-determining protein MreC
MNDRAPISGRWGSGRRTSFARRDLNLALAGALLTGVILAFALLLLILARVNPELGARVRGAVSDVLSPVTRLIMVPVNGVRALADRAGDHLDTVDKLRDTETALQAAERRLEESAAARARLLETEALLKLRRPERRLVVSAQASALSGSGAVRQATLAAGLRHGVQPRMPAIAAEGLAGRVTDVGLISARVMLLSDPNSRVPVRVERTGWTGIAAGTGEVDLLFLFDPASATDALRAGDRLVTSGDGGLFPPGLPVAIITDAGASPPRARPLVRPAALGVLSIEAPWLPPAEPVAAAPAADEPDQPVAPSEPAAAPLAPATSPTPGAPAVAPIPAPGATP